MIDIAPDLFAWADSQPPQVVVDFLARRETLFRWQHAHPLAGYDRRVARREGRLAPAPILHFPRRHPVSAGAYSPDAKVSR